MPALTPRGQPELLPVKAGLQPDTSSSKLWAATPMIGSQDPNFKLSSLADFLAFIT